MTCRFHSGCIIKQRISISPPSGVLDEIVAAGPVPALVIALTLKVYEVKGLKPDISVEVVPAPCTGISPGESGPTTFTVYPVITPFCFSTGTGDQESSAVVGSLCLTPSPTGLQEGARSVCVCVCVCVCVSKDKVYDANAKHSACTVHVCMCSREL